MRQKADLQPTGSPWLVCRLAGLPSTFPGQPGPIKTLDRLTTTGWVGEFHQVDAVKFSLGWVNLVTPREEFPGPGKGHVRFHLQKSWEGNLTRAVPPAARPGQGTIHRQTLLLLLDPSQVPLLRSSTPPLWVYVWPMKAPGSASTHMGDHWKHFPPYYHGLRQLMALLNGDP